jgi:hypothetical protein
VSRNAVAIRFREPQPDVAFVARRDVYGEEVDDLRTVDYDGLSALNISATQELARRVQHQKDDLAALAQQNLLLRQALASQSALLAEQGRLAALEAKDRDVVAAASTALRASR